MVQKIQPRGVIWIPSISPHAGRLSEKEMTTWLSSMKMSVARLVSRESEKVNISLWSEIIYEVFMYLLTFTNCIYICSIHI